MGDVYKRSGSYGYMHFDLNWLQKTLLRSARRGAETEYSIKVVHREGDLTCSARESILRARDGGLLTDSIWNTSFRFLN